MKSWISLVKKETRQIFVLMVISFLLVTAWEIFLATRGEGWPVGSTLFLGFLPFNLIPFIMFFLGFQSFKSEWDKDTIYFLRTLPRKGIEINTAKFFASFLYFIVISVYTLTFHLLAHKSDIAWVIERAPEILGKSWINESLILLMFFYFFSGVHFYIIAQFSYLVSCFFNRFRLIVSILTFIISHYLILRLGAIIAYLFDWLPDFYLTLMLETPGGLQETPIYLGSASAAAVIILLTLTFILSSKLAGKYLDV